MWILRKINKWIKKFTENTVNKNYISEIQNNILYYNINRKSFEFKNNLYGNTKEEKK